MTFLCPGMPRRLLATSESAPRVFAKPSGADIVPPLSWLASARKSTSVTCFFMLSRRSARLCVKSCRTVTRDAPEARNSVGTGSTSGCFSRKCRIACCARAVSENGVFNSSITMTLTGASPIFARSAVLCTGFWPAFGIAWAIGPSKFRMRSSALSSYTVNCDLSRPVTKFPLLSITTTSSTIRRLVTLNVCVEDSSGACAAIRGTSNTELPQRSMIHAVAHPARRRFFRSGIQFPPATSYRVAAARPSLSPGRRLAACLHDLAAEPPCGVLNARPFLVLDHKGNCRLRAHGLRRAGDGHGIVPVWRGGRKHGAATAIRRNDSQQRQYDGQERARTTAAAECQHHAQHRDDRQPPIVRQPVSFQSALALEGQYREATAGYGLNSVLELDRCRGHGTRGPRWGRAGERHRCIEATGSHNHDRHHGADRRLHGTYLRTVRHNGEATQDHHGKSEVCR